MSVTVQTVLGQDGFIWCAQESSATSRVNDWAVSVPGTSRSHSQAGVSLKETMGPGCEWSCAATDTCRSRSRGVSRQLLKISSLLFYIDTFRNSIRRNRDTIRTKLTSVLIYQTLKKHPVFDKKEYKKTHLISLETIRPDSSHSKIAWRSWRLRLLGHPLAMRA